MIIALNQYWFLDLELDLHSTDIELALSTGLFLQNWAVCSCHCDIVQIAVTTAQYSHFLLQFSFKNNIKNIVTKKTV